MTAAKKFKMHVCFLTGEYPRPGQPHGGIGTLIKALTDAMIRKQIKITVIITSSSSHSRSYETIGLLTIISLPTSTWQYFKYLDRSIRLNKAIQEVHKNSPIDILEGNEISLGFVRKIPGIKYVIRMNGGHHFFAHAENRKTELRKAIREKRSFSKADVLIAVSKYVNETTARLIGFDPSITKILPNAINAELFKPGNPTKVIRHRILFAGSLVEKKGIRQLVMAMPIIRKKYPDAHLVVFGNTSIKDPATGLPYLQTLEKYIDESAKDSIQFCGFVNNQALQKEIEMAEVCCYPSHMEALPLAWIEVMCTAKPFVASKTGPGPELIEHGVNGLLCNPYDPADIADKIIYCFEHKEEVKNMGKAARERVLANYDIESVVVDNIHFFEQIINASNMKNA